MQYSTHLLIILVVPIQLQVSLYLEHDLSGYIPVAELALNFINTNSCVFLDYHISFTDVIDPQMTRSTSVAYVLTLCVVIVTCYGMLVYMQNHAMCYTLFAKSC